MAKDKTVAVLALVDVQMYIDKAQKMYPNHKIVDLYAKHKVKTQYQAKQFIKAEAYQLHNKYTRFIVIMQEPGDYEIAETLCQAYAKTDIVSYNTISKMPLRYYGPVLMKAYFDNLATWEQQHLELIDHYSFKYVKQVSSYDDLVDVLKTTWTGSKDGYIYKESLEFAKHTDEVIVKYAMWATALGLECKSTKEHISDMYDWKPDKFEIKQYAGATGYKYIKDELMYVEKYTNPTAKVYAKVNPVKARTKSINNMATSADLVEFIIYYTMYCSELIELDAEYEVCSCGCPMYIQDECKNCGVESLRKIKN